MQRKRGRGKNSSNLSEVESPESGQIADLKRWIVSQNELLLDKIKTELDKRLGVYQQDEEDDGVHQSKEDGEQDDEGQNPKKDGQKPDEDEDEDEDGGEEGGDDGAQSSVRHDDGVQVYTRKKEMMKKGPILTTAGTIILPRTMLT
ncbi:rho GTPase-activating protein 5 [Eutrema salsugineum]|nr:rho GTPase-activating protein 5 [Eutrema salsugineum]